MRDRAAFRAGLLAGAAIVICLAAVVLPVREQIAALLAWVGRRGALSGVLLCLAWIPAAVLVVPGSVLTLGTGFLLGPGWGLLVVSIGSTLGATAAFLVGRKLGRDWVRERLGGHERLSGVDGAIEREGLKVVLLLRLSPLIPYNALNYALSLTGVSLRDYVIGSWLGMLPGTVLYVALGAGARSLAAAMTGAGERTDAWIALGAAGLVATAAAVWLVARAARRALAVRTDAE
ncbi:MAG TPA: TVP38/TMEM64 family protein [Gemmatimonadota bacterium]|nr:TVP38/TMEM64 family protein [Gemmatimonadota bacterium]